MAPWHQRYAREERAAREEREARLEREARERRAETSRLIAQHEAFHVTPADWCGACEYIAAARQKGADR